MNAKNFDGGMKMYKEPIFLSPVYQKRIWGGQNLKKEFGYDIPFEQTGEAWVMSVLENESNIVKNGPLANKTLLDLWENHSELFNKNNKNDSVYPLLVKILDANANLSVQVHPDDTYAREIEKVPYGKTECWYVLNAREDASIILGHHAQNREELDRMTKDGEWDKLLQTKKVNPGDFFYVPSGTIHAIGEGIMILEIQQSSDITYRVYDYDRTDDNGAKRELHLEKAKEVTTIPHKSSEFPRIRECVEGLTSDTLIKEKYFTVYHWILDGTVTHKLSADFLQVNVIKGEASIKVEDQSFAIQKGDNFIIPHSVQSFQLVGNAEFVVSHITE